MNRGHHSTQPCGRSHLAGDNAPGVLSEEVRTLAAIGTRPGCADMLTLPRTIPDGPAYARLLNRALLQAQGNAVFAVREGSRLAGGGVDHLLVLMNTKPLTGILGPVSVGDSEFSDGKTRARYMEWTTGRCFPVHSIPGECFLLRRELSGTVGLFDESLSTVDEVLSDYGYRLALAGYEICLSGDTVIALSPKDPSERRTPRPYWRRSPINPSDPVELTKREVLAAVAEAAHLEADSLFDEAVTRLDTAINNIPESPKLHSARAWTLLRSGRYRAVSDLLLTTPDAVKRNREWLDITGFAMFGLGELTLARQCVEKALEIDPRNARAVRLQGMIHADENSIEEAIHAFRLAIQYDPSSGESYAHLGALLWARGEKEEAYRLIEHGFLLSPTIPEVLGSYREAVYDVQMYTEGARAVADVRRFYPVHKHLAYLHAECLTSAGAAREALTIAVECLGRYGPEEPLLELALTLRGRVGPIGPAATTGISLCMITKNEESMLAACLAGMETVVDEIIVVDTGSSDRTPMVAEACGARVFSHSWQNDYAEARNAALGCATGGWVLTLDADERLAPRDRAPLAEVLNEARRSQAAVLFTTRNYVHEAGLQGWCRNDGVYEEEAGSGWVPSDKVRFFPRQPEILYDQPVHEVVEPSLQRKKIPILRTQIPIHHYGRLNEERTREKAVQYTAIGRKKVAALGATDLRAVRELAAQEQELGNHSEAIPLWEHVLRADPVDARAMLGLGVSLAEVNRREEALQKLQRAIELDPALREAPVKYALVALELGNVSAARTVLEQARCRESNYPFSLAAYAAVLACAGEQDDAMRVIDVLTRHGVHSRGFFSHVALDLERAGQSTFARTLKSLLHPTERTPVEP